MKPVAPLDIISRPFPIVEADQTPELIESRCWPEPGPHQKSFEVRRLGLKPGTFIYESAYERPPDLRLHRLRGALLFNSLTFSRLGVYPESLRYRASEEVPGFSLPTYNPRRVSGAGREALYAFEGLPENLEPVFTSRPALVFHTVPEYGHYLTEALPMLWFLPQLPAGVKLAISAETEKVPDYLEALVAPFGLGRNDFLIPGRLSVFEDLYLPGRPHMDGQYQSQAAREVYGRVSAHYAPGADLDPGLRLYVSRSSLAKRRLVNEDLVENLFRARGFEIVRPETMTVPEQVALFARASAVAGPAGSGLHNVLFSSRPESLKVLILAPDGFASNKSFFQIEQAAGRQPTCLLGRYLDPAAGERPHLGYEADWRLDPEDLKAALEEWPG